ncbi:hypothetical protein [uncultured Dysgonomonas sp.]|uniref:Uncharacterized protein n=1 Tax=uncultured Dysgonomonas sp. TaxID=206096 RepID=A0A212IXZ4_9BACT|nr:hypothetical protein [uncultured Dysgonomonas sp.]SBV92037.1 conserved hypothetical protein [uncultured Dysgonomonas sp.]
MKKLKITNCSDKLMWYRDKVGQTVPFLFKISEGYMSREDAGFTNIVLEKDAEIIEE